MISGIPIHQAFYLQIRLKLMRLRLLWRRSQELKKGFLGEGWLAGAEIENIHIKNQVDFVVILAIFRPGAFDGPDKLPNSGFFPHFFGDFPDEGCLRLFAHLDVPDRHESMPLTLLVC